jgi:hypothetical protein
MRPEEVKRAADAAKVIRLPTAKRVTHMTLE